MKVDEKIENLRQIILIEDFKDSVNVSLKTFIDERGPKNLNEAACLADEYALIHQSQFHSKSSSSKGGEKISIDSQSSVEKQPSVFKVSQSKTQSSVPTSSVLCN